jgi:hypothetical protein
MELDANSGDRYLRRSPRARPCSRFPRIAPEGDGSGIKLGGMGSGDDVLMRRILEPDPGLAKSISEHHESLESAIADLVDNSIDAHATDIVVIFEVLGDRPIGLTVVDNGDGMNGTQADDAMRLGRQRAYETTDQGHFGVGLKAASLSQADTLTVYTTDDGHDFHGRRLRKAEMEKDFGVEVLKPKVARLALKKWLGRVGASTGTVVQWSDTSFPKLKGTKALDWLADSKTNLRMHLGLIYHLLLASDRVNIEIEVYDRDADDAGPPEAVTAIDPFGFAASTKTDLIARIGGSRLKMACHVIPPKSSGPQYRLYGRDGAEFQGFYIYRNERILQIGGWQHVTAKSRNRSLARVKIDDFKALSPHVNMSPGKNSIRFRPDLIAAISEARSPGRLDAAISFDQYLHSAEGVLAESKRRDHSRKPVAQPGTGIHENVRRVISEQIPLRTNEGTVEIRWKRLKDGKFMELDRDERTVYLNQRYRSMFTGGITGVSDAPLLKSLVFLLTQDHFTGQYWGSRDRDLIDMWNSVLGAAVRTEETYRLERES